MGAAMMGAACALGSGPVSRVQRVSVAAEERERADRMPSAHRATSFLRGRLLVRRLLADLLEVEPTTIRIVSVNGRPVVPAYRVGISISHAGDHTLAAARRGGAVGVDVVRRDTDPARVPAGAVPAGARAAVVASGVDAPPELLVWAATEAALKAAGTGLTVSLDALRWAPLPGGCLVDGSSEDAGRWAVALNSWSGLVLATAVPAA
jgi:phosphopantetheinyl transferase